MDLTGGRILAQASGEGAAKGDPELFAPLEEGRLDITFGLLPAPAGPFETVELFTDPFVLIVSQGSPWRIDPVRCRCVRSRSSH